MPKQKDGIDTSKSEDSEAKEEIDISFIYIIIGFTVVSVIVFQLIFAESLQEWDVRIIKSIQSTMPRDLYTNYLFVSVTRFLYWYTSSHVVNGVLCFLYCAFNTFVSFRVSLLANLAIYVHAISIVLIYKEPKPYWTVPDVRTASCEPVFTGPAYNQFLATLVVFYSITVFKHYQLIGKVVAALALIGILTFLNVMTLVISIVNAEHFIYQNVLGIVIAAIILLVANFFDREITLFSLRLGFFAKSSKRYKFVLLIILLFVFTMCLSITTIIDDNVLVPPNWIKNYNVFSFPNSNRLYVQREVMI